MVSPPRFVAAAATVLGLAALALAPAACGEKKAEAVTEPPAPKGPKSVKFDPKALARLGIKVDVVGTQSSEYDIDVPGSLEYNLERYAEVGTLVDGRVATLGAKVGDEVKSGHVLATIVVPSIANAQAEYIGAEANARLARENEAREESLLKKELTTAREAEQARAEVQRTQAELQAAKARLQALGVAAPAQNQALSGAGTLLLKAPLDGVVVRRDAVLGRFLLAKETAFVIADPLSLRAVVNVYESDLPYFHVGSEATIAIDAMPGKTFKGKIAIVEPQVGKASRAARAYIDLPNPDGLLKPGLFIRASVRIPDDGPKDKVLVPAGAVQPLADDDVVFVELGDGKFEVRTVEVARRTPQIAEIRKGVATGDRIVVEGAYLLRGEVTKQ